MKSPSLGIKPPARPYLARQTDENTHSHRGWSVGLVIDVFRGHEQDEEGKSKRAAG